MLTRRDAILGGTAVFATAGKAHADGYCSPFDYRGVRTCQVGVNIGPVPTAQQECQNWCWAACIEAVFSLHGHRIDQRVLVEKVYGSPNACRTATGYQIANAITGDWIDGHGRPFRARAEVLTDLSMGYAQPNALARIWDELARGKPLINGAVGHATVLTAMTYLQDTSGRTQLTNLTVRDPWPYSPNRRDLMLNEVYGTFFVCKIDVY